MVGGAGPIGPAGPIGVTGPSGPTGLLGEGGDPGAVGPTGVLGESSTDVGPLGATGSGGVRTEGFVVLSGASSAGEPIVMTASTAVPIGTTLWIRGWESAPGGMDSTVVAVRPSAATGSTWTVTMIVVAVGLTPGATSVSFTLRYYTE